MAPCLVNATPKTFAVTPETWGQMRDALDRSLVAGRRVVTAVRFDGVDQPTFRSPAQGHQVVVTDEAGRVVRAHRFSLEFPCRLT